MPEKIKEIISKIKLTRMMPFTVSAIALIAACGALYSITNTDSHLIWIVAVLLYIITVVVIVNSDSLSSTQNGTQSDTFIGSMTLEMMVKMPYPVVICSSDGKIAWYNSAFNERIGSRSVSGHRFEDLLGKSITELKAGDAGTKLTYNDRSYNIKVYSVSSNKKRYFLTLWDDVTEYEALEKKLEDDEIQIAYLLADNIEELSQYTKDGVRAAANEVDKILKSWAEESQGVLKEYQANKYVFFFRASNMNTFLERKFDLLDKIRDVRVGESSFSLTVSMGVSNVSGTLSEKERVAQDALDMALQRGGDQVVVKSSKGLEFYGGKTQTVQKRTKVRSRVIANELASLISSSSLVLIVGHKMPDFDCIGASLGIARLCNFCGVPFRIVSNIKDENFRRCYDRIKGLNEYSDLMTFCNASEAQDLIGSDTLVVVVDVNNINQIEAPDIIPISHRTVYIDHHRKTAEFEEVPLISYIEPSASSASELVAEILEQSLPSGTLSKEEADIMYSGILLDTKQFTRNTGVRTFGAALYLRGEGASPSDALTLFKSSLNDFVSEAKFESNVVIYRGCMAISCNDAKDNTQSDRISAAKAADKLLTVENVEASFALCRIEDSIHISARSTGEINVQLILEKIGGGGHFDSAATRLNGSINEALTMLKNAIDEYMSENHTENK